MQTSPQEPSTPPLTLAANLDSKPSTSAYSQADIVRAYEFPIFASEDLMAYRSVMHFYLKDYHAALSVSSAFKEWLGPEGAGQSLDGAQEQLLRGRGRS